MCGSLGIAEDGCRFVPGHKVDADCLWFFPIRRDLQDRWAAEAAMSDQHFFAKVLTAAGRDHFRETPARSQ